MTADQSARPTPKVWVRHADLPSAHAAARRLAAKYGARFALVRDEMGITGFIAPFAVVGLPLP